MVEPPPSQNNILIERKKEKNKTESAMTMSKDFVHKFGMLKGQRLYDQAERLAVKSDHVQGTIENSALKASVSEEGLAPIKMDLYSDLLPRRNPKASSVNFYFFLRNN